METGFESLKKKKKKKKKGSATYNTYDSRDHGYILYGNDSIVYV